MTIMAYAKRNEGTINQKRFRMTASITLAIDQ